MDVPEVRKIKVAAHRAMSIAEYHFAGMHVSLDTVSTFSLCTRTKRQTDQQKRVGRREQKRVLVMQFI